MDAEQQQPPPPPPPPSFISAQRELEGPVNQDVLGLAATLGSHGDSDGGDDNDDDGGGGGDGGDGGDGGGEGGEGGEGNTYTESNHSHDSDRNNDTTTAIAATATATATTAATTTTPTPTPTATTATATIATTNTIPTEPVARLRAQLRRAQEHESQLVAQQQQDQLRLQRSRDRLRLLEQQRDVVDQRDRLRRVMSRLSRLNDDSAAPSTAVAYGDRVPRQNSLYDWSPATAAAVDVVAATGEASRQTALVQAVRRHSRFATRTREPSQRPHAESAAVNNATRDTMAIDRERRDMLSRADSYRRGHLDRSLSHTPPVSPVLEHTVKYLSRIRHCATIDDTLKCALDAGFLCKDYFRPDNDFITDTSLIAPPADTSWLAPGAVFSGYQHATSVANPVTTAMHRFRILDGSAGTPPTALPTLPAPSRPWISNPYSTTRSPSSRLPDPHSGSDQDRWPVKVTIHAVDWSTMSLSATMEAYNVPSHPHSHQSILGSSSSSSSISSSSTRNASNAATTTSIPSTRFTRTSSITTYLEGEILDFNTHTLLTESFKSSAENDATYWRKLPPFATMSDDDMVHALTSRKWYEQVLGREWILMRWKERCFVKSLHKRTGDDALATASPPSATSLAPMPVMSSSNTVSSSSSSATTTTTTTTTRSSIPLPSQYTTQLQPSPYRIVRNPQTGRAQVEISTDMPSTTSLTSSTSTSTSHPPSLPPPLPLPPSSTQQQQQQQQHATFDDSGCGLTISGFYYVCLRRCDGALEGLYFDPQSSPYQSLRLESLRGGLRGAWAFR